MPRQIENPRANIIIRQNRALWHEAMRAAKRILKEDEPVTWEDREQMERYYAAVPMIAMKIHEDYISSAYFLIQAPEKDQDSRFDKVAAVLAEAKAQNDEEEAAKQT
jgi:hypothetical protein